MTKKFRFAPSPTGMLHVGNVRTALINWLAAHNSGGKFILRVDDTDSTRSKKEFEDAIKTDLEWLGLNWDSTFNQKGRAAQYEKAKNKLIADGRLYPCYETKEELEMNKKLLLNRGLPPIYKDLLTDEEKQKRKNQKVKPHWRFKLLDGAIEWEDEVRGKVHFDAKNISDPVLIRADGTMTYSIASVVDDIEYGITHIIRGEDHLSNSAVHVQLFEALGAKAPNFAHLSLIKSLEGGISKRTGGFDIATLRKDGLEAQTIVNFLAKVGSSESPRAEDEMADLIESFSFKKFSKAPTKYDPTQLFKLNAKRVHGLKFADVKGRLNEIGLSDIDEDFWNAVHQNLEKVADIKEWWDICRKERVPFKRFEGAVIEKESNYLKEAITFLPEGKFNNNTWKEWTNIIKEQTGRKGKELFLPLRTAITGKENGPEMNLLLPLIGRDRLTERLRLQKVETTID